ncbi:MAG: Nuclear transport factor 2 [Piccolia ochrophora]|nr:MAG: Nuclear transport factor 2 [Piccolia ochrophora]
MAADPTQTALDFLAFYYQKFDSDRTSLGALYRDNSVLTFEGTSTKGVAEIGEKLASLPFEAIRHDLGQSPKDAIDLQPSPIEGGLIILVNGIIHQGEEGAKDLSFVQVFHLLRDDQGQYFVFNDIFRLTYPV